MLFTLLGILVAALLLATLATQVLRPLFMGTPFFPVLRRRNQQETHTLVELQEQLSLAESKVEQEKLRERIENTYKSVNRKAK